MENNGLKIVNITATGDLHQSFDLSALYCKLLNFPVQYEPEIYPAVLLKIHNNNHCTIFSSGKFVITGVSSVDELEDVYEKLIELIKKVET
jgi:TATA-box binding protein (TBP) (component of TFIID and TFIIIB)